MSNQVIAITGTSGFIGSVLLQELRKNGYTVIALNRRPKASVEERFFDLNQPPDAELLKGVDVLIHCAFISAEADPASEQLNEVGTNMLTVCARQNGVKKIIFFSSVSGHANARSAYGKSKFRSEALFDMHSDVVLKCSLVIGTGGLFSRMVKFVRTKKFIPLIEGGRQPLQVIAINDVVRVVLKLISENISGNFVLANREHFTYRQFFKTVATACSRSP